MRSPVFPLALSSVVGLGIAAGLMTGSTACGSSTAATATTPQPVAPMPTYYPTQQPGTMPQPGQTTAPQPYIPPTAPTATAPAPAGTQATPLAGAAPQAAAAELATLAASQLPAGMQPDGAPFAGQFAEGQTLEQSLSLLPGKCYSIAAAGVGITTLHIDLIGVPIALNLVSSDPGSDGIVAVLGPSKIDCWKYPFPIPGTARIVVKAVHGAGLAAAQVYVR